MEYLVHLLILIEIYCVLVIALDLMVGYTGLISLGHAAFFGIGAYTAALLTLRMGTPALVAFAAAGVVAGLAGLLVALPSLRVRDDYFVLATFALQVVVTKVFENWKNVTGGFVGLAEIPSPFSGRSILWPFACGALLAAGTAVFSLALVKTPWGRLLRGIREDEILLKALGKDVNSQKVVLVTMCSAMAGLAGAYYAFYVRFIDPSSFTVMQSILVIAMVIIGGAGSLRGPILGAALLVLLPEVFRFAGFPSSVAGNLRNVSYGILIVAFMRWRPSGLLGEYEFRVKRGAV